MALNRETFSSRFGLLVTMIGVAVGLGNVWRFPYMVGRYGGAPFVAVYVVAVLALGIPALMAEWTLGRSTRRGTLGAFEHVRLPFGRSVGRFLFAVVAFALGYYANAVGWVMFHAAGQLAGLFGLSLEASRILPPPDGFSADSLLRQLVCTALVLAACATVVARGLRRGIERASRVIMPALLVIVALLLVRTLTLPGAWEGVRWYVLKFDAAALTPRVVVAALGHAFFSLSLGGTFMVVYGSYLDDRDGLQGNAAWTATGDLVAGLVAGLAILPAVIALGHQPDDGPGLIFGTLPAVFEAMPLGALFGVLFFGGLFGAAYLSAVAALEVLVAGIDDNTKLGRPRAAWLAAGVVLLLAVPPMVNMRIFVPWDLTFGSGMQVLGALVTVLTVGWWMERTSAIQGLLWFWLRWVVPGAILAVGVWWLLADVLGVV